MLGYVDSAFIHRAQDEEAASFHPAAFIWFY